MIASCLEFSYVSHFKKVDSYFMSESEYLLHIQRKISSSVYLKIPFQSPLLPTYPFVDIFSSI